jgi:CHASE1-domain containing sensor protein
MKRTLVSVAALLSLSLAAPVFAAQGTQPSAGTGSNFEQMKADHLNRIQDRINSLQEEKSCVQAAKNQEELKACRMKHKADMKERRDDMRKRRGGPGGPGSPIPPQ